MLKQSLNHQNACDRLLHELHSSIDLDIDLNAKFQQDFSAKFVPSRWCQRPQDAEMIVPLNEALSRV